LSQTVQTETMGQCRIIRLNRPDSLNSFTIELHQALIAALRAAGKDETLRSVILTGAGRAFCAGQDLQESSAATGKIGEIGDHLRNHYNPLVRTIRELPIPVISAVNGVAAGAGMSLALSCDVAVAAKSARFMPSFTKIGLVPDSGATWMLPRLVGPMRARLMALLCEPVDAETALSWGLVTAVAEDDKLLDTALEYAQRFAALPPSGITLTKQALEDGMDVSFNTQLENECTAQTEAGKSPHHAEAVAAFIEKRPPVFTPGKAS